MAGPIRRFYDFYRPPPHYPGDATESDPETQGRSKGRANLDQSDQDTTISRSVKETSALNLVIIVGCVVIVGAVLLVVTG